MSAYRLGLSGGAALFAVKKYKSHRRVPEYGNNDFIIKIQICDLVT